MKIWTHLCLCIFEQRYVPNQYSNRNNNVKVDTGWHNKLISTDGTFDWRLSMWQDQYYYQASEDNVLFGYGHTAKLPVFDLAYDKDNVFRIGHDKANEQIHNYLINIFARGGLLQLFTILSFHLIIYYIYYKKFKSHSILIFMVPPLFNAMTDISMEGVQFPINFYLIYGYLLSEGINLKNGIAEKMKKALITGITGQDGYYLSKFLLEKNYEVHGTIRRASLINTYRIDELISSYRDGQLTLHYSDLLDSASLSSLVNQIRPDEVYNLAAQSHVSVSFKNPVYTTQVGTLGSISILEAIRGLGSEVKFYQASSSEMYGGSSPVKLNEMSPFDPKSPYAASKVFAHDITKIYRDSYELFCVNGILFNHESPMRVRLL